MIDVRLRTKSEKTLNCVILVAENKRRLVLGLTVYLSKLLSFSGPYISVNIKQVNTRL